MGSATWRPNSITNPYESYWNNTDRMYDNDTSNYGVGGNGGSKDARYLYFQGNVPSDVETAAKYGCLTSITVNIIASAYQSAGASLRMVYGVSSDGSSFTDAGDGEKTLYSNGSPSSRSIKTHTFSMSSAVGAFNSKGSIIDYSIRLNNKNNYGTSSYWLRVYDVSITVEWSEYNLSFNTHGGNSISSVTKYIGSTFGTLPTPTRAGFEFAGWYKETPCYHGGSFNGSSDFAIIPRSYMYTNNLSIHIEAYMPDWSAISSKQQIMSCTEGGGWGIGYQANTTGHGTEIYIDGVGYKGINFGIANLSSGWHSFDVLFTNGTFSAKVDGTSKGSVATGGTAIKYHASNVIFVGAEAGSSASTPGGNYFSGKISSVLIANKSSYLKTVSSSDTSSSDVTLHAAWRPTVSAPPVFSSAALQYSNAQVSASNKVQCSESYIISVGVS